MDQIEHVVVLMLENRSFDSMLGWLYEHDAADAHYVSVSDGAGPGHPGDDLYRGLQSVNLDDFVNTALNGSLSAKPKRGARGFTVPTVDPHETFPHVNTQFFGKAQPAADDPITMKGLLADYIDALKEQKLGDSDIRRLAGMTLETFTPGQLPILNQLAKHYAVCDDWFASVPSQTNPNRAFLMCGTSCGLVNNGELEEDWRALELEQALGMAIGDDRIRAPTIFNALHEAGIDWTVFWQTSYLPNKISTLLSTLPAAIPLFLVLGHLELALLATAALAVLAPYGAYLQELTSGDLASSYTWRLFPEIQKIPDAASHFQRIEAFHARARRGTLPRFSYLEPFWSISHTTDPGLEQLFTMQGNDYHPPGNLLVGEAFVKDVYSSLIANRRAWQKTLLLITFDEFVGTFDHVTDRLAAGVVTPPWGRGGQPDFKSPTGFKFDRLGARVPTIVVSPYVKKGTVLRSAGRVPFDHTSVIATTLEWLGQEGRLKEFGERTDAAPSFAEVLELPPDEPRTDERELPFLDVTHNAGDPMRYGDAFVLKNRNGQYLTTARFALKVGAWVEALIPESLRGICVDIGVAAHFPTLGEGQPAVLSLLTRDPDPRDEIDSGTDVLLVSREASLGALNVLGAWKDSPDCYYADEYIDGENREKQRWTVHGGGGPLRYGDSIRLENGHFRDQYLTHDSRWFQSQWITTEEHRGDSWTVEPAEIVGPRDIIDGTNVVILSAGQRVVSWDDGFQTCKVGSYIDGTHCRVLNAGQFVVSSDDGFETCQPNTLPNGTTCVILDAGQRVVSWEDGFQTCKPGAHIDGTNCVLLQAGQRIVSSDDGFKTCKPGILPNGTTCVILNAGQRVVSTDDGFQTCKPGAHIDNTNCVILNDGDRVVSWEDGFQTCKPGDRIDGTNCVVLRAGQRVVSWDDGYETCKVGSHVDGTHCLVLEAGQRVVSTHDGFTTCAPNTLPDGITCVILHAGQRVVSWDDGFQTCKPGSHIDSTHCLILEAGQFVVSSDDGFQSCKPLAHVDNTDCVLLNSGQRVASWDDGFQTCKPGSHVDGTYCRILGAGQFVVSSDDGFQTCKPLTVPDGTTCVTLSAGQRVVSHEDGFQSCRPGSHIDSANCVILNVDDRVVSWDDGYQTCKPGSYIDGTNCVLLQAGQRVVSWEDGFQT